MRHYSEHKGFRKNSEKTVTDVAPSAEIVEEGTTDEVVDTNEDENPYIKPPTKRKKGYKRKSIDEETDQE